MNAYHFVIRSIASCVCFGIFTGAVAAGQDPEEASQYWHQWRGPLGTGVAPKSDAPLTFSETKNIKWKIDDPGLGFSTPIIWGDKIFMTTAIGPTEPRRPQSPQKWTLLCLDRSTGKTIWSRTVREEVPHEGYTHPLSSYANQSPVTDGQYVYVFFGSQGAYCFDFDGNLMWERDFGIKLRMYNGFGESSSPALFGDYLALLFDNEDQSHIEVVNKKTGKTVWKALRDEQTTWTSPHIVDYAGKKQVVVSGGNFIRSYDLTNGEVIWQTAGNKGQFPIPAPVTGFGMAFVASGSGQGLRTLRVMRLDRTGDLTGSDGVVWTLDRGTPDDPTPLLYGNELYILREGALRPGGTQMSCLDAKTGKQHYFRTRLPTSPEIKASPVGAGDKIYLSSEAGDVFVVKRGVEYEVLATNHLDDLFLASPAIAGGEIYLRGKKHLYCIAEK